MYPLLIVIVVLSPLPFASVYEPAWLTVAVLVGLLLIVWSIQAAMGKPVYSVPMARIWPAPRLIAAR